jgi:ABC-type multidrug transport system fused ATPase/permease subunit
MELKIKISHTDQSLGFWLSLRLNILSFIIYSIIMILIGICIYQDKYELITFLSLAMTTALNITDPLSSFLPWLGVNEDKFRAVERIRKTLNKLEDERDVNQLILGNKQNSYRETNNNFNSAIEFKYVSLKYDLYGNDILKKISFNINKGQKIAIIGR